MILTATTETCADLDTATASDEALVRLSGLGDQVAHAELWLRHGSAARAAARRVAVDVDPDVVVQEAFARIELALRRGLLAAVPFRLHVYETVREVVVDRVAASGAGAPRPGDGRAEPALSQSPLARAFRSLPALWRSTLWYLDVEGAPARSVALWAGVPLADLPAVARTARAALRRSWVHAQACAWGSETACATTAVRISRYLRGQLRDDQKGMLEAHLVGCTRCAVVLAEFPNVSQRLELVLLPGVLGAGVVPRDGVAPGAGPRVLPAPDPTVPAVPGGPVTGERPVLGAEPGGAPLGVPHQVRRPHRRRRGGGEDFLGSCTRRRCP